MATIYNDNVSKRIRDDADIQISRDKVPNQLAEKVVPVLISNPQAELLFKNITVSDAASGNIFVSSSTKRTFILGYQLSVAKDVVSDSTNTTIKIQPVNSASAVAIATLRYEPVTAGTHETSMVLPQPMEITKGSAPRIENSSATASIDVSATLWYYQLDKN